MGYYDVTVTLPAAGYVLYTSGVYTFCGSTCLHVLRKLYALPERPVCSWDNVTGHADTLCIHVLRNLKLHVFVFSE